MLNFQNIYRILNHGETVQIGVNNQVSHITVNKQFAPVQARLNALRERGCRNIQSIESAVFALAPVSQKNPGSSSTSIFDHSALLLMSVSMSFMEVNDL
ncbi:Uncharacterised protein [Salmonella enterica subsp. enterica]|uniref:Uncharacterized protein n=1 Tax=Salmonella enterica I TaxID=59201 RepID=A0A3S4HRV6_SALET|nr:Uncharacterised protein [Salmonella enterica subsp. enterica]